MRQIQIIQSMLKASDVAWVESRHKRLGHEPNAGEFAPGQPSIAPSNAKQKVTTEEKKLAQPIKSAKELPDGTTGAMRVILADGTKAIFKPELKLGSPDKRPKAEVTAWEIGKLVGMEDLLAPAIMTSHKGKAGALIAFKNGEIATKALQRKGKQHWDTPETISRVALFDFITGNPDRNTGNWLVDGDKIHLIDQGEAFPESEVDRSNSIFGQAALQASKKINTSPAEAGKIYMSQKEKILAKMREAKFPKRSIEGVAKRIDELAALKSKRDWAELVAG